MPVRLTFWGVALLLFFGLRWVHTPDFMLYMLGVVLGSGYGQLIHRYRDG